MKFGQLIEYDTRNIFPEKSYTKSVGKTGLDPFLKKKLSVFLDQQYEVLYSLFLLYDHVKGYQNILKLR